MLARFGAEVADETSVSPTDPIKILDLCFDVRAQAFKRRKRVLELDRDGDALTVLHDGGIEPRSGTKLTSRYAVLVVEDSAAGPAIEKLSSENLKVSPSASRGAVCQRVS